MPPSQILRVHRGLTCLLPAAIAGLGGPFRDAATIGCGHGTVRDHLAELVRSCKIPSGSVADASHPRS